MLERQHQKARVLRPLPAPWSLPGAAAGKIPKNSQAQPGDTIQVTGLKPHALSTVAALMGAAVGTVRSGCRRPNLGG